MLILCISENSHISIVVNREMIILYYFLVLPFIQTRLLIMKSDGKLARSYEHDQNQGLEDRDYFWVEEKSHRYKCMHMKNRMETQTVPEHSKITITCTRGCIKMKRVSGPRSHISRIL